MDISSIVEMVLVIGKIMKGVNGKKNICHISTTKVPSLSYVAVAIPTRWEKGEK